MDLQKIRQLLSQEEGPKLDFKAELHLATESEKKELVKDVIAMANSRGGRGHILVGVEDKTKVVLGIEPGNLHEEQIQQIIYNRSNPPVPVTVDYVACEGKTLLAITVFRSLHKPHQMVQNGAFYVRRGSTTDYARRDELATMLQENGLLSFETILLPQLKMTDLDMSLVQQFLLGFQMVEGEVNPLMLEAIGIVQDKGGGDYSPTIGGLLLFGKNPELYFPQHYIKISSDDETIIVHGPILQMLDDVMLILHRMIPDKVYPFTALEEAIANALAHRDYLDLSRGIHITISPRNIEVANPGALIDKTGVYHAMHDQNPERRNPWLYQRLVMADNKRRFHKSGVGMNRIQASLEGYAPAKFINLGQQNLFKAVMPGWQKSK